MLSSEEEANPSQTNSVARRTTPTERSGPDFTYLSAGLGLLLAGFDLHELSNGDGMEGDDAMER